jgi:hypothetical protein
MSFSFLKAKQNNWFYIALLFIIAIVGYWQIAFLKYSVTHDMINCWIPWRYYISNCIQNHTFPFWNPYQQLGYPIHADLQGPMWYLESILLSITVGQDNYTVQLLFVFYVFIAGVGMYFLSLCFQKNKNVAFLVAICYMLSGFFVAHVQHFYAVIGAAWLPFIILNYYKLHTERSYKRVIYASLFMFFNLTGGNHTFTFILSYLFISIAAYFIIVAIKEKKRTLVFQLLKLNVLFISLTVMLSTVVIVAFFQVLPYVQRLSGMTYQSASFNPLSPQSLLSLLVPFSTVNSSDFYNTDPSMCNVYIGIILLPFIILGIISKKALIEKLFLIFAVVCLFASFGAYTPVHKFLFSCFPFINLFRFPSYFSLFTMLLLLLLGGRQLAEAISSFEVHRKKLLIIVIMLLLLIFTLWIIALVKNNEAPFYFLNEYNTIFEFIGAGNLYQNIILQGSIQLLLLAVLTFVLIKPTVKWVKVVSVLVVIDMIIATQLNVAYVGFSPTSPKELHDYILTLPKGFPIPSTNNIIDNKEELGQKHGLYRNTSIFHKRISADVFNSFCFTNQVKLMDIYPNLYDSILSNPVVYLSDKIVSKKSFENNKTNLTHQTVVIDDETYNDISSQIKLLNSSGVAGIVNYQPDRIIIATKLSSAEILTLLQSYYDGWQIYIDNKPGKIIVSNYLTMSALIPAGKHIVEFRYKNPAIIIAGIISYSTFLILLVVISVLWIKENKNYWFLISIWLILFGSVFYYL